MRGKRIAHVDIHMELVKISTKIYIYDNVRLDMYWVTPTFFTHGWRGGGGETPLYNYVANILQCPPSTHCKS